MGFASLARASLRLGAGASLGALTWAAWHACTTADLATPDRSPCSGRLLAVAVLSARFVDEWLSFLPFGALDDLAGLPGRDLASAGAAPRPHPVGGLVGGVFIVAADHVSRRLLALARSARPSG